MPLLEGVSNWPKTDHVLAVLCLEKDRTSFTLINLEAFINCTEKHRRGEVYIAGMGYTSSKCRKEKKTTHQVDWVISET